MLVFKEVFVAPRQLKLKRLSEKKALESDSENKEEVNPQFKELIKEEKNPHEIKIKKKRKSKKVVRESGHQVVTLLSKTSSL